MAFSVTNIGTAHIVPGAATISVTVGAGGVPAGALVFFGVYEGNSTGAFGTASDSKSNPYSAIQHGSPNNSVGNGAGGSFYAKNIAALVQNDTITYTLTAGGGSTATVTACYVTGADTVAPLDTAVTNIATGSSTTSSVTGGTASVAGELNIGFYATDTGSPVYTQASGFSNPPNSLQNVEGGNEANAGTAGLTYNPSTSVSHNWVVMIQAFKAAVAVSPSLDKFFDLLKVVRGGLPWDQLSSIPARKIFSPDVSFEQTKLKRGSEWNAPFIAGTTFTGAPNKDTSRFFDPIRPKPPIEGLNPFYSPNTNTVILLDQAAFFAPNILKRGSDFLSQHLNVPQPATATVLLDFGAFFTPVPLKRSIEFNQPYYSPTTNTALLVDLSPFFDGTKLKRGVEFNTPYIAQVNITTVPFDTAKFFEPVTLRRGDSWHLAFTAAKTITAINTQFDNLFEPTKLKRGAEWNTPYIAQTTMISIALDLAPWFLPVRLKLPSEWLSFLPPHLIDILPFITDTTILQLPINCILADQQDYEIGPTEIEENAPNIKTKVTFSAGNLRRLSDNEPSFTTKTSKKGHD